MHRLLLAVITATGGCGAAALEKGCPVVDTAVGTAQCDHPRGPNAEWLLRLLSASSMASCPPSSCTTTTTSSTTTSTTHSDPADNWSISKCLADLAQSECATTSDCGGNDDDDDGQRKKGDGDGEDPHPSSSSSSSSLSSSHSHMPFLWLSQFSRHKVLTSVTGPIVRGFQRGGTALDCPTGTPVTCTALLI